LSKKAKLVKKKTEETKDETANKKISKEDGKVYEI
jgi:hypothetical protein